MSGTQRLPGARRARRANDTLGEPPDLCNRAQAAFGVLGIGSAGVSGSVSFIATLVMVNTPRS